MTAAHPEAPGSADFVQPAIEDALSAAATALDRSSQRAVCLVLGKSLLVVVAVGFLFAATNGGWTSTLSQAQSVSILALLGLELLFFVPIYGRLARVLSARACYQTSQLPSQTLATALTEVGPGREALVDFLRRQSNAASESTHKDALKRYLILRLVFMLLAVLVSSDDTTRRSIAGGRLNEASARMVDDRVAELVRSIFRKSLVRWSALDAGLIAAIIVLGLTR